MTPHVFALLFPKLWTLSTFLYFLIIHHCVFVASSFSLNNDKSLLLFFLQGKKVLQELLEVWAFFKPINHAVNLRVISVETFCFSFPSWSLLWVFSLFITSSRVTSMMLIVNGSKQVWICEIFHQMTTIIEHQFDL